MTPDTLTPSGPSPVRNRRRVMKFALFLFGACLLAVVLCRAWSATSDRKLIWLAPTELTQSTRPGLFTRFGYKVKNLTAPLWQRFRRNRPQIHIDSNLMTVAPEAARQAGLGAAVATNALGLHAWILSPQELIAFERRLKSIARRVVCKQASGRDQRWWAGLGRRGRLGPRRLQPGSCSDSQDCPRRDPAAGRRHRNRKNRSHRAQPREPANELLRRLPVSIPNGGGLVISTPSAPDTGGGSYWFIVSPAAIDPRGNRIQPE